MKGDAKQDTNSALTGQGAETAAAPGASSEKAKVSRLVIPKNAHIPIKQTFVDIFHKTRPEASSHTGSEPEGTPKQPEGMPSNNLGLDVAAAGWAGLKPERTEDNNSNDNKQEEPPKVPVALKGNEYLSPDEQCPPKKRGRKKAEPEDKVQEVEEVKKTRKPRKKAEPQEQAKEVTTRKRGKCKPDEEKATPKQEDDGKRGDAAGSTPDQRLRQHLGDAKAAKAARQSEPASVEKQESDSNGKRQATRSNTKKSQTRSAARMSLRSMRVRPNPKRRGSRHLKRKRKRSPRLRRPLLKSSMRNNS